MVDPKEQRRRILKRLGALKNERSTWVDHWTDLSDNFRPRRGRFISSERNKGTRNNKLINNTPTKAARVLASGKMAGISSPARPWFRLTTPGFELDEHGPIRAWLHAVEQRLRLTFARSNLYNCLHSVYGDLGVFGTAVMHVEEDSEDLVRGYVFPVGQYYLANSSRLQIDTVYRELGMTVGQLVQEFGIDKVSAQVRDAHKRDDLDSWVDVIHVIEPNAQYEQGKIGTGGKRWRSCWLEAGKDPEVGLLRESGFDEFPVMAPRWDVTGEDVYGMSPGMDALGDCRALQLLEKRKATLIELLAKPPMKGPASLRSGIVSQLPGGMTYVDESQGSQTLAPTYQVNPQGVVAVGAEIREHQQRINGAMYADLWLMMIDSERKQITAREVAERHEEKMLQLGPVLERLQDELLDPLIDRVFGILYRRGELPPPPPELEGVNLKVEYISMLAQAQKALAIAGIERVSGFAASLSQVKPEVLDNLDADEAFSDYLEAAGVNPKLLVPREVVLQRRQQRAQQQAAAAAAETAATAAQGAKTLSETSLEDDSALTRLLGTMGAPGVRL